MKEKNGEHPLGDSGQLILLGLFLIVWAGDSFLLRLSTFLSNYVPLWLRLMVFGLVLVIGYYFYRSGHSVVSHEHPPAGVVSTGAFRYVRNPLYLASILFYLGLSISTLSLLALVLLVIIFVFYNYIASYEERLLESRYGDEYKRYKTETGKWIPKIGMRD
jgi:protein-S-isoprenylcysteine O-methyltransferase Ste14